MKNTIDTGLQDIGTETEIFLSHKRSVNKVVNSEPSVSYDRIVELEEMVRTREQREVEVNSYVQALKNNLIVFEDTMNKERNEHATTK